MPGCFNRHSKGFILEVKILGFSDGITKQSVIERVRDLIHKRRLDNQFPAFVILIKQVQFRTVTIPERISHRWHQCLVMA